VGDFSVDTHVEGNGGRYRAQLSRDWEIWGPNGGYLASIALRAAGAEARIPRPASFAGQFLRVAEFAPVEIEVTVLRSGSRSEALRASILQDGRPVFEALVRTAAEGPGLEHEAAPPPRVPHPETIPAPEMKSRHRFWGNFDCRWVEPPAGARDENRPFPPHHVSWHRFRPRATFDDPFLEAARALLFIDTMTWPAASLPHPDGKFIAPNLDVTAWFHGAAPESEWLLVEHASPVARAGLMGTAGRVFDESGRLLASGGAQLFCVPAPPQP
jgi:acyl-CoA thioesterase II